ncbi:MAG: NAD(P)H-dependent glycerol-3-phosphate dehydrogenase [Clostridia bacterium]|nr:NAD(P)H-dependent glycerol-3-phosphate dehydrogenase [Clostridia bacterium]
MNISVIGCGRWGAFIAWYLDSIGHNLTVFGPEEAPQIHEFIKTRTNGTITFREEVKLTTSLADAMANDVIVISIPSQNLRSLMQDMAPFSPKGKIFILCMKGIEITTGKRLSEVVSEYYGKENRTAVWIGPGHPQEFVRGVPNCMVIDSYHDDVKKYLVESFSGPLIRFYYGNDIIGNELGAATKNVIGIAAGMLDGAGISSLKGALMSRATTEIARFIGSLGGDSRSAYGLCHLGDYEATVFSKFSHNRAFGEAFIKGEKFSALAEGYYTAEAVHRIAKKNGIDMPICEAVYSVLYENKDAHEAMNSLFARPLKKEF